MSAVSPPLFASSQPAHPGVDIWVKLDSDMLWRVVRCIRGGLDVDLVVNERRVYKSEGPGFGAWALPVSLKKSSPMMVMQLKTAMLCQGSGSVFTSGPLERAATILIAATLWNRPMIED